MGIFLNVLAVCIVTFLFHMFGKMPSTMDVCFHYGLLSFAFQVLVDVAGVQVPLDDKIKFCVPLGENIQKEGLVELKVELVVVAYVPGLPF